MGLDWRFNGEGQWQAKSMRDRRYRIRMTKNGSFDIGFSDGGLISDWQLRCTSVFRSLAAAKLACDLSEENILALAALQEEGGTAPASAPEPNDVANVKPMHFGENRVQDPKQSRPEARIKRELEFARRAAREEGGNRLIYAIDHLINAVELHVSNAGVISLFASS